jgi:protein TonB
MYLKRFNVLSISVLLTGLAVLPLARAAEPPVPIRMVAPEYPYELKRNGVNGVVTVAFSVDEKGAVVDPVVKKSTNPGFNDAALAAIAKWKFKPAMQDGTPVQTKITIPLAFTANS